MSKFQKNLFVNEHMNSRKLQKLTEFGFLISDIKMRLAHCIALTFLLSEVTFNWYSSCWCYFCFPSEINYHMKALR